MSILKLDAFLQPTRTVEWKGKKYKVLPVTLRKRMEILGGDREDEESVKKAILDHIPDFPADEIYDLPPLALVALFKFVLQVEEDERGKN